MKTRSLLFVAILGFVAVAKPALALELVSPVEVLTCTNQFLRGLSALGIWTCASVENADLVNSTITLNAGASVGLTAPGVMTLGGTYTFGATTDQPQFAGLGLGGAATGANRLSIYGSTSGRIELKVPAIAGANALTFPAGTTDFSLTGGASQVVKQLSAGGALTVGTLSCADLSDDGPGCSNSGVTSPGGTTGNIQYNNAGSFGGLSGTGLVLDQGAGAPAIYGGASCPGQAVQSLSASGVPTCVNTGTASTAVAAVAWIATSNPDKVPILTASTAMTITDIRGRVATPVGNTAAISLFKAPSGTACSSGTNLINAVGTFNANGTADTNSNLTLAGAGAPSLAAGDSVCMSTANGVNFTAGVGIGGITVTLTVP